MEIKIDSLKLSYQEFISASKLYKKSQANTNWKQFFTITSVLLLLASSPLILIGIFLPEQRGTIVSVLGSLLLFFSSFFLLGALIALILRFIVWIIFSLNSSKFPSSTIVFTGNGIEISQAHTITKINWLLYNSALENKKMFLLIKDKNSYMTLPKRAFSVEQQEALRYLIKEHVPSFLTIS